MSDERSARAPDLVARLRAAGCVFAEEEAALLRAEAAAADDLERMVRARVGGLPLEQVLGWAEFDGLRVSVSPGVFVPRRRTAALARTAAALLPRHGTVVDLCCGSGAVGAAVLARRPDARLTAADVDETAVACARRNLPQAVVVCGDLFSPLPPTLLGAVDVLAVNAPYVPSGAVARMPTEARVHEPRIALDGGPDGLDVHARVAAGAAEWLAPYGCVVIETSDEQAPRTAALFIERGYGAVVHRDEETSATLVVAALHGRPAPHA